MRRFLLILLLTAGLGAALAAQEAGPASAASLPPDWQAGFSEQTAYNSDVLESQPFPIADWEQDVAAIIRLQGESPTGYWKFQYRPYAEFFRRYSALDSFNQLGDLKAGTWLTPRLQLNSRSSFGYLDALPNNTLSGLQPLARTQTYAVFPRTREEAVRTQLGLLYMLSPRASVEIFGGYRLRRFPQDSNLTGERGTQAGLNYRYQWSLRTRLGMTYLYQNMSLGSSSHLAADSVFLSWRHAFTPDDSLRLFAGPQYSHVHDTLKFQLPFQLLGAPVTLVERFNRARTYPAYGGRLAHRGHSWRWSVSALSEISNGGGVLPFPVSMAETRLRLGPRLSRHWRLRFGLHYSWMNALAGGALSSRVQMAAAGVELRRQLNRQLSLGLNYNYLIQHSHGLFPMTPAINRNFIGLRLAYRWHTRRND